MITVTLPPDLDRSVDALLATGRFGSRAEIAVQAVQMLVDSETDLRDQNGQAELRAMIQEGIDAVEAGNVVELDEAFDRIDALIESVAARTA